MASKIFATFAAPTITAIIAFILNKYIQNKPKLIAYYGHISSHKIPVETGYQINSMAINAGSNKLYTLDLVTTVDSVTISALTCAFIFEIFSNSFHLF